MKFWFGILGFFLFITANIQSSDLESRIKMIVDTKSEEYLKNYMTPFATAFGTISNGAIYHRAYTKRILRFDIGVSALYLQIPKDGKTVYNDGQEIPTVFGANSISGTVIPGTGVPSIFIPIIQANIGFVSNLELTVRYTNLNLSEFGKTSIVGGGVKYGLSDMIPVTVFPLDFSVQAMWHIFSIEDWINSGNLGMNIQASTALSVLPIDIYGGVGYDNTWMQVSPGKIPDIPDTYTGDVSINGDNKIRATLGIGFGMKLVNAHIDYNIGFYNSTGMGLMIVF